MFVGNMVTEPIPARVYALYRIVLSKKNILKTELQGLMEPKEIYGGSTSYFSIILNTALELKLIDIQDNYVSAIIQKDVISSIDDVRRYIVSKLNMFENEQFYKCTNIMLNLNEKIFEYPSITDNQMLNYLSKMSDQEITAPMIRGWRFWAQFLGFGYMEGAVFLPNAYIFVKDVIRLLDLKKEEYQMDEFIVLFKKYGGILLNDEKNLNLAFSSALRELHENGELELKYISDKGSKWILYPSKELYNNPVSAVVYKGEKR